MITTPSRTGIAVAVLALAALAAPAAAGPLQRDVFSRPVKKDPKRPAAVEKEAIVAPPALADRAAECKKSAPAGQEVETMACMYLVREVQLQGVFRAQAQPEAFLFAVPTKRAITVREGDRLFDGRVVSIQEAGPSGGAQIVLEKVTKRYAGRKVVETKELVTLDLGKAGR